MNELPKSVRDELARQQQSGTPHPDADLLTAFAEGTATPQERAKIEQHLATCSECREVIFLATPTSEAAAPVVSAPRLRPRWFPVWAPWAAAAAILVAATFTFTRSQTESYRAVAKREPVPAPTMALPPVPSPTEKAQSEAREHLRYAKPDEPIVVTKTPPSKDSAAKADFGRRDQEFEVDERKKGESKQKERDDSVAYYGPIGGVADGKLVDSMKAAPAAVPPPAPAVAPTVALNQAPAVANRSARNTSLKPGPAAPAQNQIFQNQQNQAQGATAAKSAENTAVSSETVEVQTTPSNYGLTKNRGQWRISTEGKLEHSTADSNWSQALAPANTEFTVVANIGPVVWAGGTHGALFRSDDNGASWLPIRLPGLISGSGPTISQIRFRDAFVGTVTASDGRSWTTRDRGNTWQQH